MIARSHDLAAAPASLGSPLHPPAPGRYLGPIADTDTGAWDRQPYRRRWQRKSWVYIAAFTAEWSLGVAIADAGYVGQAFFYVFHRPSGRYVEEKVTRPFAFPAGFRPGLRGEWALASGRRTWRIRGQRDEPRDEPRDAWRIELAGKRLRGDLLLRDEVAGMTAIAVDGSRPFNSTYKVVGLPLSGTLSLDGGSLSTADAFGSLDFTVGYPPRDTFWNWACFVGVTDDGRRFGMNAVAHFNQDLENALWLDGALVPLGGVAFQPGRDRRRDAWQVDTADGAVKITFEPEGARAEKLRLGLVESRFIQPFGRFHGTLRTGEGDGETRVRISGHGVVEEHHARW